MISTWIRGLLRPFESMSSVGANFCRLNSIPTKEFLHLLEPLVSTPSESTALTVDCMNSGFGQLASVFGERIRSVKLLSVSNLTAGSIRHEDSNAPISPRPKFRVLMGCEMCLSLGYHSFLHQVPEINKCLLHGTPLVQIKASKNDTLGLPEDLSYVTALSKVYATSGPTTLLTITEMGRINAEIAERTSAIRQRLRTAHRRFGATSTSSPAWLWCMDHSRIHGSALHQDELLREGFGDHGRRVLFVECPEQEARAIMQVEPSEMMTAASGRRLQCDITGEVPQWKHDISTFARSLTLGHEHCLCALKSIAGIDLDYATKKCFGTTQYFNPSDPWEKSKAFHVKALAPNLCSNVLSLAALDCMVHGDDSYRRCRFLGARSEEVPIWAELSDPIDLTAWHGSTPPFDFEALWDPKRFSRRSNGRLVRFCAPSLKFRAICDAINSALVPMWIYAARSFESSLIGYDHISIPLVDRDRALTQICIRYSPIIVMRIVKKGIRCEITYPRSIHRARVSEGRTRPRAVCSDGGDSLAVIEAMAQSWKDELHSALRKVMLPLVEN